MQLVPVNPAGSLCKMSFILSGQCEASQTFLFWNKATCHSALLCTGSHALLLWVSIAVPHLFVTTTAAKGLNRQTFPFSDAGNANVSHALQAEMQGCTVVRQLDVVTSALCASSADIWILDQASSSSTLMALASSNEHCSRQQVNHIAEPSIWHTGYGAQLAKAVHLCPTCKASMPYHPSTYVDSPLFLWKHHNAEGLIILHGTIARVFVEEYLTNMIWRP